MPNVLITGANRGVGLELARQYCDEGWRVTAFVRNSSDGLDDVAARGSVQIVKADLTDDAELKRAVDEVEVDSLDLLINNAGMMGAPKNIGTNLALQPFGAFDRDEWHEVFDINVFTPLALTELLFDKLRRADNPVVAMMSSQLGSIENNLSGGLYVYRASKTAVNAIMKSLAINLKDDGITSVSLHPGWVKTDMGGPNAQVPVSMSASGLRGVLSKLSLKDSGRFIAFDGADLPY
ncbi:MAG: SDR family oxidoreductase [Pseudomonadota bacterium]